MQQEPYISAHMWVAEILLSSLLQPLNKALFIGPGSLAVANFVSHSCGREILQFGSRKETFKGRPCHPNFYPGLACYLKGTKQNVVGR